MIINYGINRKEKGGKIYHRNGKLELEGDWESSEFHGKIRRTIATMHPGWVLTGYARKENDEM